MSCLVDEMSVKPRDIQFTFTEEERNKKIFQVKMLKSENVDFFVFKKQQNILLSTNENNCLCFIRATVK